MVLNFLNFYDSWSSCDIESTSSVLETAASDFSPHGFGAIYRVISNPFILPLKEPKNKAVPSPS